MDASRVLWTIWHEQLKELLTGIHGHQKKTLAFFVLGIVLSGCAVMQRVAETLSERGLSEAKMTSIERRLARFIANERIVVPVIWKLFLARVLALLREQQLYFVLDNTPFRDDLTMVYLGLLVHSRVLPVAWAGRTGNEGGNAGACRNSTAQRRSPGDYARSGATRSTAQSGATSVGC